ncbi:MAG: PD-(D/E)XK nuclease family protein [bacterium]
MTRAKAGLTISFAHIDDDGREHEESQFVGEIDTEFTILKNMHDFEKNHESDLSKFLNASRSKSSLFEPEYLRQLFFKRGLNVSALNNYLSCPIKFLYRNLIQLPDVSSSAQRYGNIIDIALNNFFKKSKQEEKILSKEVFMAEFEKSLSDYNVSEKEEEKFHERGEQAMSEYYDAYAKSWTAKVDAQKFTERDFKLSNGDNLRLSGTVDKIEYLDDLFSPHIHVVDHKTGRAYSEKTKEEKENYERQLVFYKLLLENPGKEDFIVRNSTLDFIEKNKKGVFEQHDMEATKEDLDKLCAEIDNCADEVLSMKFLTMGCNKKDCEWCSLFKA